MENLYIKDFEKCFSICVFKWSNTSGEKNFDQIVVSKSKSTDENIGIIREKEGVY